MNRIVEENFNLESILKITHNEFKIIQLQRKMNDTIKNKLEGKINDMIKKPHFQSKNN